MIPYLKRMAQIKDDAEGILKIMKRIKNKIKPESKSFLTFKITSY